MILRDDTSAYHMELLKGWNEWMVIKCLEECTASSKYSWPLNKKDLYYVGPLILKFSSTKCILEQDANLRLG